MMNWFKPKKYPVTRRIDGIGLHGLADIASSLKPGETKVFIEVTKPYKVNHYHCKCALPKSFTNKINFTEGEIKMMKDNDDIEKKKVNASCNDSEETRGAKFERLRQNIVNAANEYNLSCVMANHNRQRLEKAKGEYRKFCELNTINFPDLKSRSNEDYDD